MPTKWTPEFKKAYMKQWHEAHKASENAKSIKWAEDPENYARKLEINRAWQQRNKEEINFLRRKYAEEHPEEVNAKKRLDYQQNKATLDSLGQQLDSSAK